MVQCLPGIGLREVLGSNLLGGHILCTPSPLEDTLNRGLTAHALICEELKDPGIPPDFICLSMCLSVCVFPAFVAYISVVLGRIFMKLA